MAQVPAVYEIMRPLTEQYLREIPEDMLNWKRELGIAVALHPPDDGRKRAWCTMLVGETTHTPRHFLDRNADIVFAAPVLVACPAEETGEVLRSGTWSTVRAARRRGRYIVIVRPSGRLEIERGVLMWEGGPPL
jgi:hypothetical protein